MTNRGQWIAVGGVLTAIGGVLVAAVTMSNDLAPVSLGSKAPAFRAVSLATGDSVALDHYAGDVVLLMSNGAFGGLPARLTEALAAR